MYGTNLLRNVQTDGCTVETASPYIIATSITYGGNYVILWLLSNQTPAVLCQYYKIAPGKSVLVLQDSSSNIDSYSFPDTHSFEVHYIKIKLYVSVAMVLALLWRQHCYIKALVLIHVFQFIPKYENSYTLRGKNLDETLNNNLCR